MNYYKDDLILIRDLTLEDAPIITNEEIAQGWNQKESKYIKRYNDTTQGKCIALVAMYKNNIAGYINLYYKARSGPFINNNIPEIVDFGVLVKYRNLGIGTKLMDTVETLAKKYSDTVCLAVGLHEGYGTAQRMYAKRSYIPDGTGVWYNNAKCKPYSDCINDDDLTIYMSKKIG